VRSFVLGDLLGNSEIVKRTLDLELRKYDFVLYNGDIPNPSVFKAIREKRVLSGYDEKKVDIGNHDLPQKALNKAIREVVEISNIIEKYPITVFGVLGNADNPHYEKFIKWPFQRPHNKLIKVGILNFIGYDEWSCYIFEKENQNERAFCDKVIEEDLSNLFEQVDTRKTILITHAPPFKILDKVNERKIKYANGTYGPCAKKGHIGSTGEIKDIVDVTVNNEENMNVKFAKLPS